MFDLKVIQAVLGQLEEERGIPREKIIEAIEAALATAYKKEYGKKGQIVRAKFDTNTGEVEFFQVKVVVDPSEVIFDDEAKDLPEPSVENEMDERIRFNAEHHMLLEDAKKIKKGVEVNEEIIFPLEMRDDYGRIAAQTAKQVIIQKIREAEKVSVISEFGAREGEVVTGTVQRTERGNIYLDIGRSIAILPYEEQIPGERWKQGVRIRAYLFKVDDAARGVFLKVSRSHPKFLEKLFAMESPEIANGVVEVKGIAREAGSRSKIAAHSTDANVDPVGSMVGSRGVRVNTVTTELHGERVDIIEWSADAKKYIEESLSPAKIASIVLNEEEKKATVTVDADQQSLAIGKGGQNVRLAAKLTGWKIDILGTKKEEAPKTEATEVVTEEVVEKKAEEEVK